LRCQAEADNFRKVLWRTIKKSVNALLLLVFVLLLVTTVAGSVRQLAKKNCFSSNDGSAADVLCGANAKLLLLCGSDLVSLWRDHKVGLPAFLTLRQLSVLSPSRSPFCLSPSMLPFSPFSSIPACYWWAFTTVTTTGYGDTFPVSILGKIVAIFTMLCGIMVHATDSPCFVELTARQTIAFPVAILGNNFSNEWATLMVEEEDAEVLGAAGVQPQTAPEIQEVVTTSAPLPQSIAISQELAEVRRLVAAVSALV
jgi:hypothetical protein